MTLPPLTLSLKTSVVKDKRVLALDTGFDADSLEGLRLVKASRGSGWFWRSGVLTPWVTRGVLQENKRLVVWGDLESTPDGTTPVAWPLQGEEGRVFLMAFIQAWTARCAASDPLDGFSPSSVVPFQCADGWAFAFLPPELRGVLDSLQPLGDRLAWDHLRLPEGGGEVSWAFTSGAVAWTVLGADLPWAQDEEAHLRQEIRDLKRSLSEDELPEGPDPETLRLWFDSLTTRGGTRMAGRWQAWAKSNPSWSAAPSDATRTQRREAAAGRRQRRRSGAAFWRSKGALTTVIAGAAVLVLSVVGSIVWGLVKPDPTDTWTPQQVVEGYYGAINEMDADLMRKITTFDKAKQPDLGRDQEEATNLYVIRQVRTAYEHGTPVDGAQQWLDQGRPVLAEGRILYGVASKRVEGGGSEWVVRYQKWISESAEGQAPIPVGAEVVDRLTLTKTGKGWKISGLVRQRQPLP